MISQFFLNTRPGLSGQPGPASEAGSSAATTADGDDFMAVITRAVGSANPVETEDPVPPPSVPPQNIQADGGGLLSNSSRIAKTSKSSKASNEPATAVGTAAGQAVNSAAVVEKIASDLASQILQPGNQDEPQASLAATPGQSGQKDPTVQVSGSAPLAGQLQALETSKQQTSLEKSPPAVAGDTAKAAGQNQPSAPTTDPAAFILPPDMQVVEGQEQIAQQVPADALVGLSGISGALNTERMKFAGQKNEVAGSTAQKLPRVSDLRASTSAKAAPKMDSEKLAVTQEDSTNPVVLRIEGASNNLHGTTHAIADITMPVVDQGAQVEKVSRLVSQEAVMIRQSGATSLAVSLKVDAHTEVFVQLTNHDGQIQASVRCERGSLPGLGTHWDQLQESLSRQNIQLLPLAERISPRSLANASFGESTASRNFDQPSQQQERPAYETRGQVPQMQEAASPSRARSVKPKNSSPRGWESWA